MGLRSWLHSPQRASEPAVAAAPAPVEVRIAAGLFATVREHAEDFSRGEEAGFLVCSLSRLADRDVLLARRWLPVPDHALRRGHDGSVLSWSAEFNSEVLATAVAEDAVPVLVHSHGCRAPRFSGDDRAKERALFGAFSRMIGFAPTGSLLLGSGDAAGSFWSEGANDRPFSRLMIVGGPIEIWPAVGSAAAEVPERRRLARQSVAIGPLSERRLASAKVGLLGVSGGGSHVAQQLIHQGVGTLIPVDDELIDLTNLGRFVGATLADVDETSKVAHCDRLAAAVDPSISVAGVEERFPSTEAITALKEADVIVACLDRFDAREAINAFCRRHLIPLIDIGITINSDGERLARADGQIVLTLPGEPCMRCWFLTDALLEAERRQRPPGYDQNPDAPGDPQVVSMNGVLASEAANTVLDLLTGYSGGRRTASVWRYEGREGTLERSELPAARADCPACAEQGRGDPPPAVRSH
jgi:molybdopterin-synthase adenylyltransferase